jgi:SPP1 gp7 family putative phage head morphogenesis protein
LNITNKERRKIAGIFSNVANDYEKAIKFRGDRLTADFLKSYATELKRDSRLIFAEISSAILAGINDTARAVTGAQAKFWGGINTKIADVVNDRMAKIPTEVAKEISSGGLYRDGVGLSSRIWRIRRAYERDIDYIIERGIVARKSTLELARDLVAYVEPDARRPWDWSKVYPNMKGVKVDYNAQRLARTSNTHAYQRAFIRSTKDNPFVEAYQWHASNSARVCEFCAAMDGRIFRKDEVPLDHPNGMCTISAVITKSYDEIADEIADYVNGGANYQLEQWLGGR